MLTTTNRPRAVETGERCSGKFLLFGITMVVLGAIAFAVSFATTIGTVMLLGGIMVAAGVTETIHLLRAKTRTNVPLNIISALLYLTAGCILLYNPLAGALGLTLVISAFLIGAGIIRMVHGFASTNQPHWGWFIFGGLVDLALGALIMSGWPTSALWVIGMFVGIEMMLYGFTTLGLASAIRQVEEGKVNLPVLSRL
jgi:uncharacterized membrane protein HdeD (DUF308 family)